MQLTYEKGNYKAKANYADNYDHSTSLDTG